MATIQFGGAKAGPGQKAWGQLRVVRGKKEVRLPVAVIHGLRPGKHMVVMANQHGQELNGFESIRQFVEQADPRRMKGSVFAVLSMNPRAAMLKSANWPEERHAQLVRKFGDGPYQGAPAEYRSQLNLNWIWPGKPDGLLCERIDHEVWTGAVLAPHRKADLVIDIHALALGYRTPIYAADAVSARLGVAAGIPPIVNMRWDHKVRAINTLAREAGVPTLTIEPAGQACMVPETIEETRAALVNMARFLRIMPGRLRLPEHAYIIDPWRSQFEKTRKVSYVMATAPKAGLLVPYKHQYELANKGELLCNLLDIYTGRVVRSFRAPRSGMLYHMTLGGICNKGDRLFIVSDCRTVQPAAFVRDVLSDKSAWAYPAV